MDTEYVIFDLQERKNFQEYLLQMASESEAYREHLERLQMVGRLTTRRISEERLFSKVIKKTKSAFKYTYVQKCT